MIVEVGKLVQMKLKNDMTLVGYVNNIDIDYTKKYGFETTLFITRDERFYEDLSKEIGGRFDLVNLSEIETIEILNPITKKPKTELETEWLIGREKLPYDF